MRRTRGEEGNKEGKEDDEGKDGAEDSVRGESKGINKGMKQIKVKKEGAERGRTEKDKEESNVDRKVRKMWKGDTD